MCRPLCKCLYLCVCTHRCACLCVHVPVCALMALHMCPGMSGLCIHVYACPHATCPQPCVCACGSVCTVRLCVRAHTCMFGASASCCSAVQHLTPPHTIRGIPAVPGPGPDSPGKTVPLEGMGMFPFMVASSTQSKYWFSEHFFLNKLFYL